MHDLQMTQRPALEMRWVPVTDERGETRMEVVWIDTTPSGSIHSAA